MPYIKSERRNELNCDDEAKAEVSGELNYQITELCANYWFNHGPNYQCINDIVGALEGAKLEFYSRVARSYEDTKIKANGDVY